MEFSADCATDERVRYRLIRRLHVWKYSLYDILAPLNYCKSTFDGEFRAKGISAEEPDFAWAMSQYYEDTITCMGMLQVVPSFLKRLQHMLHVRR